MAQKLEHPTASLLQQTLAILTNKNSCDLAQVELYALVREYNDSCNTIDVRFATYYAYNHGKDVCIGLDPTGVCIGKLSRFNLIFLLGKRPRYSVNGKAFRQQGLACTDNDVVME